MTIRSGKGARRRHSFNTEVEELSAQELLLAAGIQANTADMGLDQAGVTVIESKYRVLLENHWRD